MLEEFISVALEAFSNANGDVDKFELQLRRKLMVYNTGVASAAPVTPQAITNSIVTPEFEKVVNSLDVNDPIFQELENVDVNSLSDEDILALARKMGLMTNSQEESFDE
jgi:hypothetical protein